MKAIFCLMGASVSNDILSGFDLVIASIHSNLKMDEDKAMMRLIKAIENPFTRILGHLTGRLLLARRRKLSGRSY
ncbi:MAG: hypothetical protein U0T81_02935 [Saprospiraceae bacterium]